VQHHGGDEPDGEVSTVAGVHEDIDGKWVSAPGPGGVFKEVKERKVKSREEKQELVETEDVRHLGDLSDEVSLTLAPKFRTFKSRDCP